MTVLTKTTPDMTCKRRFGLWLVIFLLSAAARAQTYTDHIVRNFKISPKSSVEVFNKYGKVHIRTWENDSVKFEVDLRIQTSSNEKLNKLKSQISFDFTNTNYYITAKTTFNKSGGVFSDVVETFVPSNEVSINYVIYIPASTTLKVENKKTAFTGAVNGHEKLVVPVAHGEGNYICDEDTLKDLEENGRVLFRYEDNPNGSMNSIAGIINRTGNVMGMMPHPERASEDAVGSSDGRVIFESIIRSIN